MLTVKMLKPYYIKADDSYVRVILAYQYFSVMINKKVYQFIPVEAKEIRINRKTYKVENIDAKFAFQKGKDVVYVTMGELISLPDFLNQLYSIVEPYYVKDINLSKNEQKNEVSDFIDQMERNNVKRMIDIALDERDEEAFNALIKLL
ncbi:hypothetical protein CIL05_04625 [Virgibacillus profundi]|uniref:IDEAL domain-containing protein n=1 Tax=Virgibacillus profundi TaxID=2024555 RepID=A0A2A2II11_9BACI|nr:IDEAL domain-containing protein [Virgibacillus profundi]PAV30998.1 hypothetical protein CIL05_04625 [Virgibacillus profundi]PXY55183.1 IDEAL domain-containing protein [Virgibacillus profundi]